MPEYLISGDASNNNRASSEQATEPFVAAREVDQRFYARFHEDILWVSLEFALLAGEVRGALVSQFGMIGGVDLPPAQLCQ